MADDNIPITKLSTAQQQHMLFLFFPLKKGTHETAAKTMQQILAPPPAPAADASGNGIDPRVATGVHYFMFYHLGADQKPTPALPVPSFQTAPGKDLLVVISIYDRDFAPYISSFTSNPLIAFGLNEILKQMDESKIVPDSDPTSAAYILAHGGVAQNNVAFFRLLMRYNFSDPTIPAANAFPVNTPPKPKFQLGATFPGLTVGAILQNYPQAEQLWPLPAPKITFAPSTPPPTKG
jgi:hypothetical protein